MLVPGGDWKFKDRSNFGEGSADRQDAIAASCQHDLRNDLLRRRRRRRHGRGVPAKESTGNRGGSSSGRDSAKRRKLVIHLERGRQKETLPD